MNESVLNVYRHYFAARIDVYSQWTDDGWRPVRSELTPEIAGEALAKQRPPVSGYMIAPGSTTHVCAYDLDLDDGLDLARRLASHLLGVGVHGFVEPSRRGAHLWILLEDVTPARQIRAAMNVWALDAGMPEDPEKPGRLHPKVEVRPSQDAISDDGLGTCLRMPMMPHPKTGHRALLQRYDGTPISTSLAEVLLEVSSCFTPRKRVDEAAMRFVMPVTRIPREYLMNTRQYDEDDGSASEILSTLWGVADARPGRVSSCPAKQYHSHGDIHKGQSILPDDKRAICHKGGCVLNNDGRGRGTWELRTMAPAHA